ncbi:MFS transporter [Rhodococcus koreensis]
MTNSEVPPRTDDAKRSQRDVEPTGATPTPRSAGPVFVVVFIAALFSTYLMLITPAVVSVALRVQDLAPDTRVTSLSIVLGAGAICAVIANPLFGRLSDRTTSRWGMRRPWLLIGLAGGLGGLAIMGTATSVPMLVLGWCVTQTAMNALTATLVALLPDQIPPSQRGLVGGLMGICYPLGVMLGGLIAAQLSSISPLWMMMVPALPAVAMVAVLCLVVRDRRLRPQNRPAFTLRQFLTTFWFNPRRNPDFGWAVLGVFLTALALMTLSTYLVYYLSDSLGIDEDQVARVAATVNVVIYASAAISSLVTGWIADRLGRHKFLLGASGLVMAAGLLVAMFSTSLTTFYPAALLFGLGAGLFFSGHYTVPSSVLPSEEDAAKDMGVVNIAGTLPSSIVPLYGPLLLGLGGGSNNYQALFASGILFGVLAVLSSTAIRGIR